MPRGLPRGRARLWYPIVGAGAALGLVAAGIAVSMAVGPGGSPEADACGLVRCQATVSTTGAPRYSVRAQDTPAPGSASPTASLGGRSVSPTASPSQSSPPNVTVIYSLDPRPPGNQNHRKHGSNHFDGVVTLTNHGGAPVAGWTLQLTFPGDAINEVTLAEARSSPFQAWRVSEGTLILTATADSETLAPGGSERIVIYAHGSVTTPTTCTFAGFACQS